jgi:hypothetical protein
MGFAMNYLADYTIKLIKEFFERLPEYISER